MKVITDFKKMHQCALALGNFDGVHTAHKEIIEKCRDYAKENGILSGVLLFDVHPRTRFDKEVKLLTTTSEKLEMIKNMGVDFVAIKAFDESTMKMSPDEFFLLLTDKLNAKALFAGYDYTFGYKAAGNSKTLVKTAETAGIYTEILPQVSIDNEPVSSTKIRELIALGKTLEAQKFLGHMYFVSGKVEKGKQNGTKMGIPTANISFPKDKLMPSDGVYTGIFEIGKKKYKSLINVGKNPTFDADIRTLEVHILGFSGDIYEMDAQVYFDKKIREEIKFNSPEQLVKQINEDLKCLK